MHIADVRSHRARGIAALTVCSSLMVALGGCGGDGNSQATTAGTSLEQSTAAAPEVSLSATHGTVSSGAASTLSWSSTNASSCTASGGWSGSEPTSGSVSTGALSASTTYTLACSGPGGNASQSVTVNVSAPANPTVSLSATPGTVSSGSASTLSWSASNATSCSASGGWSGSKGMSGSSSTGGLSATTSYTLTCNGASGTTPATRSTTVTVSGGSSGGASFSGTWFAPNSVWNTPIPGNVVIEPNSAAIMAHYVSVYGGKWGFSTSTDTWTPAVIEAPASTPTSSVTFTQVGTWTMSKIPVTSAVFAAVDWFKSKGDTDSSICLYSDADGVFFNFWAFYDSGGGKFTVGTGSVFPINGPGWWNNSNDPWSGAVAGGSYCGGLIRPSEWAAGQINHALQGAMPFNFNLTGSVIFPATTTDGAGTNAAQAIPEGALLQLDPTLTDAQLLAMGVPSADLPICHAMQIYGWYDNDSSSNTFPATIRFQSGLGNGSSLYPGAAPLPIAIFNHMRWVAPPSASSVPPENDHSSASAYMVSP